MNIKIYILFLGALVISQSRLFGQDNNCFLKDFQPKTALLPESIDEEQPEGKASVLITIKGDTIGKISKYVFGNALAAWCGPYTNASLVKCTKLLAPTLLRFPGGSWADGWFLNKVPSDVPDSIYDGTTWDGKTAKKNKFGGNSGKDGGWKTTTDQYYALRDNTDVNEGLITINYAYARYGTSKNPVAQAAHMAADWVRYDAGQTKFWEIGNENGGPWEYGWMIDTLKNQDGQPQFISGELYGKQFKVFVDSMKSAAKEVGNKIYVGGQVIAGGGASGKWGDINNSWNKGFFKEVGDTVDFYVIHNYFDNSTNIKSVLTNPIKSLKSNVDYVNNDIKKYSASVKPFALTEYNMSPGALANESRSYINGMQAVVLICELIKNNFGLGARWFLNTMLAGDGYDSNYSNHPYAEFYYLAYLQKYIGDMAVNATTSNSNVLCYASRYSSGETGLVVVNKDTVQQTITVSTDLVGVGRKYYSYTFTSDKDSGDFSPNVYINGMGSSSFQFGPFNQLFDIKAKAYTFDNEIKFSLPGRSIKMITIEGGNNHILVNDSIYNEVKVINKNSFKLNQNYPNPVNSTALISYQLPKRSFVNLNVFDFQGREVLALVKEEQDEGNHNVLLNTSELQEGVYFYKISTGQYHDSKKFIVIK
jgi:hypothetical protein